MNKKDQELKKRVEEYTISGQVECKNIFIMKFNRGVT
jgi:hypothetical protein